MSSSGGLFSKLRASKRKNQLSLYSDSQRNKLIDENSIKTTTTANSTQANSISLNAGNLIVGSNLNLNSNDKINQKTNSQFTQDKNELDDSKRFVSDSNNHTSSKKIIHQLEIGYHESRISDELVLLDLDQFSDIRSGDLCELKTYNNNYINNNTNDMKKKFYFIAKDNKNPMRKNSANANNSNNDRNQTDIQNQSNRSVSVLSGQLRSLIDLPVKSKVWIKAKDKNEYMSDLIEINVKDCFLNRGDMWVLSSHLQNTCVFSGQRLLFIDTIRGTIKGIYRNGKKVLSGYIGESTRVVFRSESAKLIFLIQITEEMWNFEETGEKLFQKMVNSLLPKIFKKWKNIDTHHSITIAFAISMDLSDSSFKDLKPGEKLKNPVDHFRIVVDQVNIIHWVEIMETLKVEFLNIKNDLLNTKTDKGHDIIKGRFSPVIKSNFLELINFATTVLVDPFRQVDLRHTTTHVMIVTPGSGLYDVDYDLLNLTGKKLLSLEMTMDLICLSRAPLHIVPLFRYLDYEENLHYCIPNWLSIFFWNDSTKGVGEWHPRCKIYGLQMMGLTDNEIVGQADIPYLRAQSKKKHSIKQLMSDYDGRIFAYPEYEPQNRKRGYEPSKSQNQLRHHINSKKLDNASLFSPNNALAWKQPTYSEPVVEDVQMFNVVGDLYTSSSSSSLKNHHERVVTDANDGAHNRHYGTLKVGINASDSLAVNSLRGIDKKQSIKEFTRGLITKFSSSKIRTEPIIPTLNETNRSSSHLVPSSNKYTEVDVAESRLKYNAGSSRDKKSGTSDNNILIMKNISLFKPIVTNNNKLVSNTFGSIGTNDISKAKTQPAQDNTSRVPSTDFNMGALNPLNPLNVFNSITNSRPLTFFDNNPKFESHIFISNETWLEIKNPSVPVNSEMASRLLPVRWRDVWPHFVAKKYSKWRSFTAPADLPVTISAFPTKEDFKNNFFFRNHSVTLNIDQESHNATSEDLLRNIIYMRLVAGFQLCVGKQVEKLEELRTSVKNESPVVKYIENRNWEDIKVYMIIDSEIHRISCSQNGTIDVQRYLRKNEKDQFEQVPSYSPLIKTRYETTYRNSMIDPIHAKRPSLNWNQIDQVVAGYGDYVVDKKWSGFRSKYVVLPSAIPPKNFSIIVNGKSEILTLEELRVEGLRRLINSITKLKLKNEKEKRRKESCKEEIQPEVTFYTGSLLNFINEQQDSSKRLNTVPKDSLLVEEKVLLNKEIELFKLAHQLQHGDDKLFLVNRKWHWKRYESCFVGSEMVSWLVRNFSDITSRDQALEYGQNLMNEKLFHHVLDTHSFLDGHYFYQFTPGYNIDVSTLDRMNYSSPNSESLTKNAENNNNANTIPPSNVSTKDSEVPTMDQNVESNNEQKRPTVTLSNSVVIDIDTLHKSYKQEICTVHYDKVHNPDHCFHIRLEWLTATPKLIDDLLGNWSRICERYGLKLIELPWEELCAIPRMNPFHSFAEITLAINPWEDTEFYDKELFASNKFYYHICLLKLSGFLLDNRASKFLQENEISFDIKYSWGKPQFKYAQYIHNTGGYIAEIRENGELFLAPNNIHISRVTPANIKGKYHSSSKTPINSQTLVMEYKNRWSNYEELYVIFKKIKDKWLITKNVDVF